MNTFPSIQVSEESTLSRAQKLVQFLVCTGRIPAPDYGNISMGVRGPLEIALRYISYNFLNAKSGLLETERFQNQLLHMSVYSALGLSDYDRHRQLQFIHDILTINVEGSGTANRLLETPIDETIFRHAAMLVIDHVSSHPEAGTKAFDGVVAKDLRDAAFEYLGFKESKPAPGTIVNRVIQAVTAIPTHLRYGANPALYYVVTQPSIDSTQDDLARINIIDKFNHIKAVSRVLKEQEQSRTRLLNVLLSAAADYFGIQNDSPVHGDFKFPEGFFAEPVPKKVEITISEGQHAHLQEMMTLDLAHLADSYTKNGKTAPAILDAVAEMKSAVQTASVKFLKVLHENGEIDPTEAAKDAVASASLPQTSFALNLGNATKQRKERKRLGDQLTEKLNAPKAKATKGPGVGSDENVGGKGAYDLNTTKVLDAKQAAANRASRASRPVKISAAEMRKKRAE